MVSFGPALNSGILAILSQASRSRCCIPVLGTHLVKKPAPVVFSGPGILAACVSQRAIPEVVDFWFLALSAGVSRPCGCVGDWLRG